MKSQGLLSSKSPEILQASFWAFLFCQHIIFGGVSLLSGWSQSSKKIRSKKIKSTEFLQNGLCSPEEKLFQRQLLN
jgi:hypothetical protein